MKPTQDHLEIIQRQYGKMLINLSRLMREHCDNLVEVCREKDMKTFKNDEDFRSFAKDAFLYKMMDLYHFNKTKNADHYINTQLAMDALMEDIKKILD